MLTMFRMTLTVICGVVLAVLIYHWMPFHILDARAGTDKALPSLTDILPIARPQPGACLLVTPASTLREVPPCGCGEEKP